MVLCLNKHNQQFKLFLNLFYPYLRLISLHLYKLSVLPLTTPINVLLPPPPQKTETFLLKCPSGFFFWFFGGLKWSSRDPVMTFPFPNPCVSLFFQFVQRGTWLDDDIQIRRTANTLFYIGIISHNISTLCVGFVWDIVLLYPNEKVTLIINIKCTWYIYCYD